MEIVNKALCATCQIAKGGTATREHSHSKKRHERSQNEDIFYYLTVFIVLSVVFRYAVMPFTSFFLCTFPAFGNFLSQVFFLFVKLFTGLDFLHEIGQLKNGTNEATILNSAMCALQTRLF